VRDGCFRPEALVLDVAFVDGHVFAWLPCEISRGQRRARRV
jgi:hypothetical protein